jgi:hypothetical protein
MIQISWKKVLLAAAIIFLLSRIRKIIAFLSALNVSDILTLQPLRDSPPQARLFVTLMVLALAYVTVYFLLLRRK